MAVRTELAPDLPLVEFDAVLLERVLVNLLENAARYGAAPLVVAARALPQQLQIVVRDHGPGLPAHLHGREQVLFDKFTRGQSESTTPGVGLQGHRAGPQWHDCGRQCTPRRPGGGCRIHRHAAAPRSSCLDGIVPYDRIPSLYCRRHRR